MDGVIDPPSSVHRLTSETLRAKARSEIGFLAQAGDAIVGCAFIAEKADHFYVGKLAVLPAHQGHGVGTPLAAAPPSSMPSRRQAAASNCRRGSS